MPDVGTGLKMSPVKCDQRAVEEIPKMEASPEELAKWLNI